MKPTEFRNVLCPPFSPSVLILCSACDPLFAGHIDRSCDFTYRLWGHLVVSIWSRWHGAGDHPLWANEKRRRSPRPLVHGAGPGQVSRGSRPNMPKKQMAPWPHAASCPPALSERAPTARLERARRRRWRWLLLNMKCRSVGMSTQFRSGKHWFAYLDEQRCFLWYSYLPTALLDVLSLHGTLVQSIYCLMLWSPSK